MTKGLRSRPHYSLCLVIGYIYIHLCDFFKDIYCIDDLLIFLDELSCRPCPRYHVFSLLLLLPLDHAYVFWRNLLPFTEMTGIKASHSTIICPKQNKATTSLSDPIWSSAADIAAVGIMAIDRNQVTLTKFAGWNNGCWLDWLTSKPTQKFPEHE